MGREHWAVCLSLWDYGKENMRKLSKPISFLSVTALSTEEMEAHFGAFCP